MLDQTRDASPSLPPSSASLLQLVGWRDDETLAVDLAIIAAGLRLSRSAVFRLGTGKPPRLSETDRKERLGQLRSLWASGATSVIDEGLLRDAIHRRPLEARLLAFEISSGRAATPMEIDRIAGSPVAASLAR